MDGWLSNARLFSKYYTQELKELQPAKQSAVINGESHLKYILDLRNAA